MLSEVERLNQQITSASALRSLAESSVSEVKFAVENDMMMFQICREFGFLLTDISELEIFQSQLIFEVAPVIKRFRQPLPLAYQLTQRGFFFKKKNHLIFFDIYFDFL